MSKEPLTREQQIHLMVTAKDRVEATAKRHISHPQLRAAMARPAPGQVDTIGHWTSRIGPVVEKAINDFGLARYKQTSMFLSNEQAKEIYPF